MMIHTKAGGVGYFTTHTYMIQSTAVSNVYSSFDMVPTIEPTIIATETITAIIDRIIVLTIQTNTLLFLHHIEHVSV